LPKKKYQPPRSPNGKAPSVMDLDISSLDHDEPHPQPSQKGSVLSRNDQKWESLKQDIHKVYMSENNTLSQTMVRIEEGFGFKASWVFPRVFLRRIQSLMHILVHGNGRLSSRNGASRST
jgi:hypothetical protein